MRKVFVFAVFAMIFGTAFISAASAQEEFKPSVDFKGSWLAAGYLDTGNQGTYPDGSFQDPAMRLKTNIGVASDAKIVLRMNLDNAAFNGFDFMMLEYTGILGSVSPSFKDSAFNPNLRIGRFKLDMGEETIANNPVDGALISASAGNMTGFDEGLMLFQSLPKEKLGVPFKWSFTAANGNKGAGADNEQAKSMLLKVGMNPLESLYMSLSYYNSGDLGTASTDITFAGLGTGPANATEWNRTVFEFDVRYDFMPGLKEKRLEPGATAFSDSKAFVRLAYGMFTDGGSDKAAPVVSVTDREGNYMYLDGVYNATDKIYLAARYSFIGFDESSLYDSLNGVTANKYTRISLGIGYRLSDNVHVKTEFTSNSEDVPAGTDEPDNNQIGLLFTARF